jgi:DNA repair protein RecN (Recombination protein N)
MLRSIHIQNYALIEQLDFQWNSGLTSMTGETGSGKSIVLGALGLVLGDRSEVNAVRTGAQKCVVEATFIPPKCTQEWLHQNDLEIWPELLLRREVTDQGRSRAFVNDTPVSVTQLRALGEMLVDMHGQDSTRLMLRRNYQIQWLDSIGDHATLVENYQKSFQEFKHAQSVLSALEIERSKPQTDADYLTYQLQELSALDLVSNDWSKIKSELQVLENSTAIQEQLQLSWSALAGDSNENSVLNAWSHGKKALNQAGHLNPTLESLLNRMEALDLELKDFIQDLEHAADGVESNPSRMQNLQRRLHDFQRICSKHNVETAQELLQVETLLQETFDRTEGLEQNYKEAQSVLTARQKVLFQIGNELMKARQIAAQKLESEVIQRLTHLKMPNSTLRFDLSESSTPDSLGIERIQLLFSANLGAKECPLEQIASGGEKSRLMLAFKASQMASGLPTIILDEIDTGVSGDVAEKMAKMMRHMSSHQQVIAITHLPQVAAQADQHCKVSKTSTAGVSRTEVSLLNGEERILEIAGLLSGEIISDAARANAVALLAQN